MTADERDVLTKVPAITLGFWIIKILATTLGETGGDPRDSATESKPPSLASATEGKGERVG
jgi:hypothetical protein